LAKCWRLERPSGHLRLLLHSGSVSLGSNPSPPATSSNLQPILLDIGMSCRFPCGLCLPRRNCSQTWATAVYWTFSWVGSQSAVLVLR